MQPGLTRAVPMGIVGFISGAAFVLVLRLLQSMDPLWDAQIAGMMGGIGSTIGFLWGMGAFDRSQAHHHIDAHYDDTAGEIVVVGAHAEHDGDHDEHIDPRQQFSLEVWQVALGVVVMIVALLGFASLSAGPGLTTSNDPAANANTIGYFTMDLFGQEVVVSQLFALLVFAAFTLISLAAIGWLITQVFYGMSRGLRVAEAEGNIPLNALPASSVSGLLTSGGVGGVVPATLPRTVSERAWVVVVPNLIAFAVLLLPVHVTLTLFGIGGGDESASIGLIISAVVTGLLTLLIMRVLPRPRPQRANVPSDVTILTSAAIIFAALVVVFTIILSLAIQVIDVLYVPMEPSRSILPVYSALFLTPFVLDLVYNRRGLSLGQMFGQLMVPALLFEVLYLVFYGALIGLALPQDPVRTLVTAINSVVVTLLILRPGQFLWCIGKVAQAALWILRGVPNFLGQK